MSKLAKDVLRWLELKTQLKKLRQELKTVETDIGLDDTRDCGPYDGTNLCEYRCGKCNYEWLCGTAIPCKRCHPDAYDEIQKATT